MSIPQEKLQEVLLAGNYVSEEDVARIRESMQKDGRTLTDHLYAEGLLTKDLVGQAIAESLKVPYTDLNSNRPDQETVLQIPEDTAREFRVIVAVAAGKQVTIATDDPQKEGLKEVVQPLFPKKKIVITYSLSEDIDENLLHYQKSLETRFSKIIDEQGFVAPEILQEIFEDAYTFKASDIHFEPQHGDVVVVRFRVDGVLYEAGKIPKEYYDNIINRIKVRSNMRIDEHFAAQDGSMRYEHEGKVFDMRASIVPTIAGEKVVLRILSSYIESLSLADLGLSSKHQALLEKAQHKPFGMILVTGPTGSGKTTTLYAVLKQLLKPAVNITTIEDPVEYKVSGINQIQVNTETNLTFAKGLRSIVRQDPDIILVGEIRDVETAEIAVNAALTGHLLLSTFHTNDAATAIPRLLDMDVEPFLLASTLEVVIAQRLVRRICDECRYSMSVSKKEIEKISPESVKYFPNKKTTLYAGKGCTACAGTGYRGRTAIFEFITITPKMKEQILNNPSAREIWALAEEEGSAPLFEDGIEKVLSGATTIEELLRVAAPKDL